MKKRRVFLFMLSLWTWIGVVAQTTTTITLNLDGADPTGSSWAYRNVANYAELKVGDVLKATFELTDYNDHQLYIAGPNGQDKLVDAVSVANTTSFTHTLTESDIATISRGMTVGYVGLKNYKLVAERTSSSGSESDGGSSSGSGSGSGSTEETYAPANPSETVTDNLPKYIANWYGEDNVYRLKISNASEYKGKVLRVVCSGTGYDAYAFLKQGDGWASIMSGADKFSIAGWKYFEITINDALASYLSSASGLIIGGNNYTIQAAYVYDNNKTAEDWTDGAVVNSLDLDVDGTSGEWATYGVPGSFFGYKYENNQKTEATIANTKNNIIRIVLSEAGDDAQVSAKDNVENTAVAYLRQRRSEWDDASGSNKYWYNDYKDCPTARQVDFELSDAITVFKDYQTPVVDETDGKAGVQKGMLSTLLVNGMSLGCVNAKITKIEILESQVSKYVTGLAVHTHKLSGKYWKPISLPYNLTNEQFKEAFGQDAVFCELGKADVIKTHSTKENKDIFGMRIHFKKVTDGLKANYPYIINLCDKSEDVKKDFTIQNIKADVRDFQTYVFRTPDFDCTDKSLSSEEQEEYKAKTKGAYMNFISTAPVFTIVNNGVGDVEIYKKTDLYTELKPASTDTWYNYAFSSGKLYPVASDGIFVNSSLAYIQFSSNAKGLIDGTGIASELNAAKSFFVIDNGNETTGIADVNLVEKAKVSARQGIYNLNGQLVRMGHSVEGLAKGLYIVDGKKMMIK